VIWTMRASWTTQITVGLAGLAASSTAALTLSPLIAGGTWFLETFWVMAVVVGTGILMRRITRIDPLVLLVQVLAAVLLLTALHAAGTALLGVVPGPRTPDTLVPLWHEGMALCRQATPPVEDSSGLLLVVHCGLAAVALAVDTLAVSLRRPAAAGLPLLATYCVPAAALSGGIPWHLFVLAAAGFLALIGSDSHDRVLGWGRVLEPAGSRRPPGGAGAPEGLRYLGPSTGAKRVAAASVLVALLLPSVLPELDEQLIGPRGNGDGRSDTIHFLDPFLDLKANLSSRSDDVVIRYTTAADVPPPLRITTADRFDGRTFAPSTGEIPRDQRVQGGLPSPPGLAEGVAAPERTMKITISDSLDQPYLPLPYPTSRVEISGDWLYDESTLDVVGDGRKAAGAAYTVEYLQVSPTTQQLAASERVDPDQFERYLALPQNMPVSISRQARSVAGRGSPYQQASRLQDWFRDSGHFVYTTQAPEPENGDSIAGFLNDRHGYCAHFASAMALMARALGVPSRVATGFLPGERRNGSYEIRMRQAHAWPELFFAGIGWIRFEPTPPSRTGAAPGWTTTTPTQPTASVPAPTRSSAAPTARRNPEKQEPTPQQRPATGPGTVRAPWYERVPWGWVLGAALPVVLFLAPSALVGLARRRRLRRCPRGAGAAEAVWADLLGRLEDLGIRTGDAWTPRSVRDGLLRGVEQDGEDLPALDRLVDDLEQARYLPGPGRERDAAAMVRDVRAVVARAAGTRPRAVRLRARWLPLPRSGRWPPAGGGPAAAGRAAPRDGGPAVVEGRDGGPGPGAPARL